MVKRANKRHARKLKREMYGRDYGLYIIWFLVVCACLVWVFFGNVLIGGAYKYGTSPRIEPLNVHSVDVTGFCSDGLEWSTPLRYCEPTGLQAVNHNGSWSEPIDSVHGMTEAWDVQPALGYRAVQPTYNPQ